MAYINRPFVYGSEVGSRNVATRDRPYNDLPMLMRDRGALWLLLHANQ